MAVEAVTTGESASGKHYDNQFVYVVEVKNGLIHAVREYLDTSHPASAAPLAEEILKVLK